MQKKAQKKQTTRKLNRRQFLKAGTAGLGAAALGTIPGKVFGKAPAYNKGTTLS
ncbi:MAG: twin-arginine translocation signal domain-containing protein, partial [Deltaproteobacteria bacterium]|nr:twin-arginine translocation signal domain-containing protein [Deltaproteobacteria bacterium]